MNKIPRSGKKTKYIKLLLRVTFLLSLPALTYGQTIPEEKTLSLQDVVDIAKGQSPSANLASVNYKTKYWQYRVYESNYLPQLALNSTIPNLNRSINTVTQPDGTALFVKQSLLSTSMDLSLTQNIGLTNSQLFVSSQVQRIDIIGSLPPSSYLGTPPPTTNYLVNPIVFGIRQPIFGFNKLRWDMRIEPLKYDEAKKQFNEDLEQVSIQASEYFFDLLSAQMQLKIQEKNVNSSDTLYKISFGRFNLGKIAENELLQMELNLMRARNSLSQAQLDADVSMLKLANYLKMPSAQKIILLEPNLVPNFKIDEKIAIQEAEKNSQAYIAFQRKRLEAERDVVKAVRDNRFSADLVASYGLTNSGTVFQSQYSNAMDQQQVRVGLQVPIIDWGRAKAQIRTMEAVQQYVEISVEQDKQSLHQEVILLSKQFDMHRYKLLIAQKADTIAQKRFDISMKRYMIGKIGITDMNIALQEKDQAKLEYLRDLREFWHTYFDIRWRTLYDFQANSAIINKF
jgi:outer membrane protein TolC